jgi:hypothetical protein
MYIFNMLRNFALDCHAMGFPRSNSWLNAKHVSGLLSAAATIPVQEHVKGQFET